MPAQYSVPPAWGANPFHDLELPSGHTIQAKRIDLQAIVAAEMIDEFDKLNPTANEKVVKPAQGKKRPADRQAKKPTKAEKDAAERQSMKEFFKQENLTTLLLLMGRIIPQIVIQPKVVSAYEKNDKGEWAEIQYADRTEGVIYSDTIPLPDQMAILSFGMEGMDMEGLQSFREQSGEDLGDVAAVPVRADPPVAAT